MILSFFILNQKKQKKTKKEKGKETKTQEQKNIVINSMNCYLTILVSVYIIYVLNYFKTTYSIAHPISYFKNSYIFHPIYNTRTERSMICQFGHDASWLLVLFILMRIYIIKHKIIPMKQIKQISTLVLSSVFIVSLVNLNAVLYLLPYYILELLYIKNFI